MLARHEVLRTRFPKQDGAPTTEVLAPEHFPLQVVALDDPSTTSHLIETEITRPFHVGRDPLVRMRLLLPRDEAPVLVLTIHHLVIDGWSTGLLVRDLTTAYAALSRGGTPDWDPLPLQYGDFAAWQQALGLDPSLVWMRQGRTPPT